MKCWKSTMVFACVCLMFACGGDDDSELIVELDMGSDVSTDGSESDASDTADVELIPTSLAERDCPEDSDLTYDNFGEAVMLTWCTSCHAAGLGEGDRGGAPVGLDLDSLVDVREHADRIWARTGDHNSSMPPVGVPDADERRALGEWLACGVK